MRVIVQAKAPEVPEPPQYVNQLEIGEVVRARLPNHPNLKGVRAIVRVENTASTYGRFGHAILDLETSKLLFGNYALADVQRFGASYVVLSEPK